jgi:SSS family solute:Na+ symporter
MQPVAWQNTAMTGPLAGMSPLDWAVLDTYFVLMLVMGLWARAKVKSASDYFTAGGAMPWWLSGVSHHMSGYSSAVFVGYAAIAYTAGFSLYVWWAFTISLALLIGHRIFRRAGCVFANTLA